MKRVLATVELQRCEDGYWLVFRSDTSAKVALVSLGGIFTGPVTREALLAWADEQMAVSPEVMTARTRQSESLGLSKSQLEADRDDKSRGQLGEQSP